MDECLAEIDTTNYPYTCRTPGKSHQDIRMTPDMILQRHSWVGHILSMTADVVQCSGPWTRKVDFNY